jgi:xanthine/CO dehydrogenase XdhC/CoxF family maturation factor
MAARAALLACPAPIMLGRAAKAQNEQAVSEASNNRTFISSLLRTVAERGRALVGGRREPIGVEGKEPAVIAAAVAAQLLIARGGVSPASRRAGG